MIPKFSVKKPFTVLVAVILILVLGYVSVTKMTPDLLPEMSFPYIVLFTSYVGASPEEVEQTITKPLEQSLAALDDLKDIASTSSENYATLYLTFDDSVNIDRAMLDIQQAVTKLQGDWPDEVGVPTILELSTDLIPTVVAAVEYEDMDSVALSSFVNDTLSPKLEGTNGVASVNTTGLIIEQIEIELNSEKIDKLNTILYGSIDKQAQEAFDEIEDARQKIAEGREELENAKEELDKGESELQTGKNKANYSINKAKSELDKNKADLNKAVSELTSQRNALAAQLEANSQTRTLLRTFQQSISFLERSKSVVQASIDEINSDPTLSDEEKEAELSRLQSQLDAADQSLAAIDTQLAGMGMTRDDIPTVLAQFDQLESGIATIDENLKKAKEGLAQIESGYNELNKQKNQVNSKISSAQKEIDEGRAQIESGALELDEGEKKLDEALTEAEDQLAKAKESANLHTIITKELVAQLLKAQNFEMPAGYVNEGENNWIVSVGDKLEGIESLENVALVSLGLEELDVIRLCDVADVRIIDNSDTTYARINGRTGVLLSFTRQSSYATATVADNVSAKFAELEEMYPGLHFAQLMNQGDYIHLAISSVVQSLLIGAALAIFILLVFLRDIRPTFAVSISIPVSVMFALVLMYFSGVTMNIISMAGLAVGIGMLVDNSIVVIENIYRLRANGVSPKEAATRGASEVMGAITASTLTTICVFLPILFVQGMTRQIFMDMILTIAYSLLASLIIALTVIPAISQGLLRREVKPLGKFARILLSGLEKAVRFAIRYKILTLFLAIAILAGTAYLNLSKGFVYFPENGGTQISVTVKTPEEYTFEETCELAEQIIGAINSIPDLKDVGGMIGNGMLSVIGLGGSGGNEISIYAIIDESSGKSSIEVSNDVKNALRAFDYRVTYSVAGVSTMSYESMLSGDGFTINIYSNDLEDLRVSAIEAENVLADVEGLAEIQGGSDETTPALHITVDKEKAISHNLTTAQIYLEIVNALTGSVSASSVTTDTTSLDATIYSESGSFDRDQLELMSIDTTLRDGTKETVPLTELVTIHETETLSSIHRDNQRRYVSVSASIADGYNVTLVSADARKALSSVQFPSGVIIEYEGENETIMNAMKDLTWMLLLGILIIYLIMVAQFQSLLSPFIVILTVPLSFAGGFIGLLIMDYNMSIVAMIGMIMLVGIVVNNGIVLVDCANRLRQEEQLTKREAVVKATIMRIRPVLMTALTTILGLLPLVIGFGTGAEIIQPVAVVCIGGLTYATLMTIFIVPVLYDILRKDRQIPSNLAVEEEHLQKNETEKENSVSLADNTVESKAENQIVTE